MNEHDRHDFGSSLLELFRVEVENQTAILTGGLLELERRPASKPLVEPLLRAAHSLKGAARIVNLQPGVSIAHALEDCLVNAQNCQLQFSQADIDLLFRGIDLLQQCSRAAEENLESWQNEHEAELQEFLKQTRRWLGAPPESPLHKASDIAATPPGLQEQTPGSAPLFGSSGPLAPRRRELPERVCG